MTTYKLQLHLEKQQIAIEGVTKGYRLTMRSGPHDDPDTPNAIFLIRRVYEGTNEYTDYFVTIASPTILSSVNIGHPFDGQEYYLTDNWTLDFTNSNTMAEAIDALKNRVDLLAESLGMMRRSDTLPETHIAEYEG